MVRTILKLDNKSLTLELPDNFVGRIIEVIAFAVDETKELVESEGNADTKLGDIKDKLRKFKFNSGGYKFDRNEANEYE